MLIHVSNSYQGEDGDGRSGHSAPIDVDERSDGEMPELHELSDIKESASESEMEEDEEEERDEQYEEQLIADDETDAANW